MNMDNWIVPLLIIAAIALIIGNLSTVQKNAKNPLRKKGLNDLKETLPRSNKTDHKLPTAPSNSNSSKKIK
ncbi:MAG: hypothetical protein ACI9LM_005277 [Alteromonadaceae bacterium]|jgi:hypothetical protein